MDQERRVQHGHNSPRADVVVWESAAAKNAKQSAKIVVECKAERVPIHTRDYYQGESYGRATAAELLVMHNERQTHVFKLVPGYPGELVQINDLPKAADWGDAKRIEAIKNSTRTFNREEFRKLLFDCHCILRDVHKLNPIDAFDEISKVLFIKMYVERRGTWGTFTIDYIKRREDTRLPGDPPVHHALFSLTRDYYKDDQLFGRDEQLRISEETFRRLVKELQRFNLSATDDDVKGIAFERFLGDTFRGEMGQFFTPRTIVDFMVKVLDPKEKELVCDPAAGSGGFLIATFEHVRQQIEAGVQAKKDAARQAIEAKKPPEEKEHDQINAAFADLNKDLDPEQENPPSRIWTLAHDCIFGTDAEPRAARTSKMNMIMHGDGHGGIHYHDGFVDINGIFPGRFHVVLTNPPFGANVGEDQKFGASEQTRLPEDREYVRRCKERYGQAWQEAHNRTVKAIKDSAPILEAYEIGKDKPNRPTELLFIERCISLLEPGGRLGIVLPDGNLNNPSLSWLRRWAEGKAKLLAVVSLPEETFASADATVKASLVFLQKFTPDDQVAWDAAWTAAHAKYDATYHARRYKLSTDYGPRIASADDPQLAAILNDLAALGVRRTLSDWKPKPPPPYPRGVIQTEVGKPRWDGKPTDTKKARALRHQFDKLWSEQFEQRAGELMRELRQDLRKVDREHTQALWQHVREAFDYPVFTAAPDAVGITSTGAEGPNELPRVIDAYRQFRAWIEAGALPGQEPTF